MHASGTDETYRLQLIDLKNSVFGGDELLRRKEEIGGKALGLLSIHHLLEEINTSSFPEIVVDIPPMTILSTRVFDAFMENNALKDIAYSNLPDDRIAHAFFMGDMPFEVLGKLRRFSSQVAIPLAIRSSGLLEDVTHRPFAGVYITKMIPNDHPDPDVRFQKLLEAIKFVWASTYFKIAKDYCIATNLSITDEKMAVIMQEMVGKRHDSRFYPELSGVARSYNYYPIKPVKPKDGVVDLALGLGKTIVDGGRSWTYSPTFPQIPPPFESVQEMLDLTQNEFWVVKMGEPLEYNPIQETEYMQQENLITAERDDTLHHIASTYDPQSERLSIGTGIRGPRVLTFAPLLALKEIPFNHLITTLLSRCEEVLGYPVEIEFAMTFDPHYFGFLQVRPMVIPSSEHQISIEELNGENVIIASEMVLGNGYLDTIQDIVYVKPEKFDLKHTKQIAEELEVINQALLKAGNPYILVVFGRLGTFDPWLGIPVSWGQICGAKVVVEATQENVRVELSQGSHYFHNIINLGVMYFCMPFSSPYKIDWDWLAQQQTIDETEFTRHVCLAACLKIKVDGMSGRGVIFET